MKWLVGIAAIGIIAGFVWASIALFDDEEVGDRAEQIMEEPAEFVGEEVTVRGEVESFFPRAFTIGDSTWGDELLIVARRPDVLPHPIRSRETPHVRVTGVVRMNDHGGVELLGPEFEPFQGEPYIEAARVDILKA